MFAQGVDLRAASSLDSHDRPLPALVETDLTPWLLRRLRLAEGLARQMRAEAGQVVAPLSEAA